MNSTLIEQAESILKLQGGRMTSQRKLILELLQSMPGHPTAEEIYLAASHYDESLNLSTVYRNLRWLIDLKLVTPLVFDDDRRQERFDAMIDPPQSDHYHFRCQECCQIFEFSAPEVEQFKAQFSDSTGAEVQSASLILYGICADCRELK